MNLSIRSLKKIDGVLGPLLLRLATSRRPKSRLSDLKQEINRILIIRPGGIGDAVLLIPSLKVLRGIMPYVQIDILCEPRNRGIFSGSPFVDKVFNYRDFKDLFHMRKIHYEIVVDTEQSHFLSAVLVSKFRRSLKVGFATNGRKRIYDSAVPYLQDRYEMHSFHDLFRAAIGTWPADPVWDPPYVVAQPRQEKRTLSLAQTNERPLVCLFPGASVSQKYWPVRKWAAVVRSLWSDGFMSVLLGATAESEMAREIIDAAGCPVLNLCSKLTLIQTAWLFKQARLLISTDSGILHLGVLCDIPTVSLFGPTIAEKWGPKGDKHIVINKGVACSPCARFAEIPPCPRHVLCMKKITVDDVIKATSELIGK